MRRKSSDQAKRALQKYREAAEHESQPPRAYGDEILNSLKAEQIDGSEEKTIVLKFRDRETTYKGTDFLIHQSMPNFYFHATTAYNVLRHNGVEIGKRDFMGAA